MVHVVWHDVNLPIAIIDTDVSIFSKCFYTLSAFHIDELVWIPLTHKTGKI